MKKLLILISILFSSSIIFGQFNISGPSYPPSNPIDCLTNSDPDVNNFFDDGGSTADYSPNQTYIFTVCPDIPGSNPKINTAFGGQGAVWDVDGSDTLYVYDGPNTSSPLIGAYNSSTNPTGFGATASWANTSGCLTFVFVSDGAIEGEGWEANIQCFQPPQPIEMHMEGFINGTPGNDMSPADTGYVDICQGDSVLFVANPNFPYSFENTGSGYSQNPNNVTYKWEFSDGTADSSNVDSVWFVPPGASGYYVQLTITDGYPHGDAIKSRVRVSTTPSFAGTGPLDDTVCFNEPTNLLGGVTSADTVGVNVPQNSFQLGGTFGSPMYLPDGNNNIYTTTIHMSGFPPGTTVSNPGDLLQMCVNMEHSFLGDLEMWLECPDGTNVTIFNSYTSGNIPGGFGGGGTFLGEPLDDISGGPAGNGYTYCFSSTINNWGDFASEYNTNTIPTPPSAPSSGNTMDPNGVYAPEETFGNFSGCPLNGDWKLHIADNWSIDDGNIFSWSIEFDPSLYPDAEYYQNSIVDAFWSPDPTIISGSSGDTVITVNPNSPGVYSYQFNVEDDYGCPYDTTVQLVVLDTTINLVSLDTALFCFTDSIPLWTVPSGTVPPFDLTWEDGQTGDTAYFDSFENGVFNYIVTATDGCGFEMKDTATITMNQTLSIDSLNQTPADCGMDNGVAVSYVSGSTGSSSIVFHWTGPGHDSLSTGPQSSVWQDLSAGWYFLTIEDNVCQTSDSVLVEQNPPPEASFDATPDSGMSPLDVVFTNTSDPADIYTWDFGNGEGNIVNDQSNQNSTYIDEGIYTVTLTAEKGACSDAASKTITVLLPVIYDLPNVFTPNGDGENDYFTINAENASAIDVVIVNRWGNVLFESNDVNFKWYGKTKSGQDVDDGTYFYKFTITDHSGQEIKEHGFVQVVRDK